MGFSSARIYLQKLSKELNVKEEVLKDAIDKSLFGGYAKIWSVKDEGNYSTSNISVSKKNKDTGKYETEFSHNYVRFVGEAHNLLRTINPNEVKGKSIIITSCDVTVRYDKTKNKEYTNFVVFSFKFADDKQSNSIENMSSKINETSDGFLNVPVDEDIEELPFL